MKRVVIQIDPDLQLGTWEFEDGGCHFTLVDSNRQHLGEFLTWVDTFTEVWHSYTFMERMIADYHAGRALRFGIRYKQRLVGAVNIVVTQPGVAELGIWLGVSAAGKGIANRSAVAAINEARSRLGLSRIEFHLRPTNAASRAFITRLGFTLEAVESNAEEHHGKWFDLERYGLTL